MGLKYHRRATQARKMRLRPFIISNYGGSKSLKPNEFTPKLKACAFEAIFTKFLQKNVKRSVG